MKIVALTAEDARQRLLQDGGGADPLTTTEGLAELLRAEASALAVARRRVLADRVCALLRPAGAVPVERALELLQRLVAQGDLVGGSLGRVAAAPLRAVQVAPGHHLLLGGGASGQLGLALGVFLAPALLRRVRVAAAQDEALAAAVTRVGGRTMTVATWAGLTRTPAADGGWLALLEDRLRSSLEPVEDLSSDAAALERYVAGEQRWRSAGSRLARRRHRLGFWEYAWLGETGGAQRLALLLSGDEALRTRFALDGEVGRPLRLRAVAAGVPGGPWTLEVPGLVPVAEYRFLLGVAERTAGAGFPVRYLIPVGDLDRVAACLAQRLGVVIDQVPQGLVEAP